MNVMDLLGSGCLGIVFAWLIRTYFDREKALTWKVISASASVFIGGGVLKFFQAFGEAHSPLPHEFMAYPIGLLIGILFFPLLQGFESLLRTEILKEE